MRPTPLWTYLWPGLPQLWVDGSVSGLAMAAGFAALLNILIAGTWAWVELLGPPLLVLGWLAALVVWVSSIVLFVQAVAARRRRAAVISADDLLRLAQVHYLQGHWYECEATARQILEHAPEDVEARLLLCTLMRRTGRREEAREELSQLECMAAAGRWSEELAVERAALADPPQPSLGQMLAEKVVAAALGAPPRAA